MAEENQTENKDAKEGTKKSETTTVDSANTVKEEPPFVLPLWIGGAVLLIGSFLFLKEFGSLEFSSSYRDWVVFSDYFSNLASPTIALAVLIYVYKTFEVQRKELNETKIALEESKNEQKIQTKIAAISGIINFNKNALKKLDNGSTKIMLAMPPSEKAFQKEKRNYLKWKNLFLK